MAPRVPIYTPQVPTGMPKGLRNGSPKPPKSTPWSPRCSQGGPGSRKYAQTLPNTEATVRSKSLLERAYLFFGGTALLRPKHPSQRHCAALTCALELTARACLSFLRTHCAAWSQAFESLCARYHRSSLLIFSSEALR